MIKKLKKAFTITELVIVIAVIAILAAVLIPTFTTLIDRANRSSDESAVYNMNLILSTADTEKPESVSEALKLLEESGMDAKEYKALVKGNAFYYNLEKNRVIYMEVATNTILYPQEYVNMSETEINEMFANGQWYNLEGRMAGDETWQTATVYESLAELEAENVTDGVVKSGDIITAAKVSTAAKLISVVDYIEADENNGAGFTLMLGGDIDMKDSEWKPIEEYAGDFNGCNYSIQGLRMTDITADTKAYAAATPQSNYVYYGFIAAFTGTSFKNVEINVYIDEPGSLVVDTVGQNKNNHTVGGAIGAIIKQGGSADDVTTIENVTVRGTINGHSRAGGVIGFIGGVSGDETSRMNGKVLIQNCVNYADITTQGQVANATVGGMVSTSNQRNTTAVIEIKNCENYGNLSGVRVGGIMGDAHGSKKDGTPKEQNHSGTIIIDGCVNSGAITVSLEDGAAGGIFGYIQAHTYVYDITIQNCINEGTITNSSKGRQDANILGYADAGGTANDILCILVGNKAGTEAVQDEDIQIGEAL